MSAEVERYLKLKDEISDLDKKAAGAEAELSGFRQQQQEVLSKYSVKDLSELKNHLEQMKQALREALDHYEGILSNVKILSS